MAHVTIADRLVYALLTTGFAEQPKQSGYRAFIGPDGDKKNRYFVGKNGALRNGSAPSNSHSLTDTKIYKQLLSLTEQNGGNDA